MRPTFLLHACFAVAFACVARDAFAADSSPSLFGASSGAPREAKVEAPTLAWAYSAHGSSFGTVGAAAYGVGLTSPGARATAGAGALAWLAPVERLTLIVDAPRDVYVGGHFAPSVAAIARLVGEPGDGFALAALAKYKVEGFGTDPGGEIESEAEGGLLVSFDEGRWHLDANAIGGAGLTEEGEIDAEARARVGYDVHAFARVGLDAIGRRRLRGTKALPNGADWDFAGGGQLMLGRGAFFAALTAGPATMGVGAANVVGATAIVTLAGTL